MAIMELVDFNEVYTNKSTKVAEPKKKTRRAGAAKKAETAKEVVEEKAAEVEEVKDTVEDVTPTAEKTEE